MFLKLPFTASFSVLYTCVHIYIYNDTKYVLNDLRNTANIIVVNRTLSGTAKDNLKNTLLQ